MAGAGWKAGNAAEKTSRTWSTFATAGSDSREERGSTSSTMPMGCGRGHTGRKALAQRVATAGEERRSRRQPCNWHEAATATVNTYRTRMNPAA